jgi:hypothetical protein
MGLPRYLYWYYNNNKNNYYFFLFFLLFFSPLLLPSWRTQGRFDSEFLVFTKLFAVNEGCCGVGLKRFCPICMTSNIFVTLFTARDSKEYVVKKYVSMRSDSSIVLAIQNISCGSPFYSRFWGAFAKLRKATITFVVSVRPRARMEHLGSSARTFIKFDI